ncbi:MAG TPA: TatD family hydrolase [Terriglobia bacterium]|nr:TatD family hydrolase [Terriglobia bacterium]
MAQFLDSHCHLDDSSFDSDREAVIERARAAGITYLLTIGGSRPEEVGSGLPIAAQHDWIYTSAGIHPHEALHARDHHFDLLRQTTAQPKVIAIGEIGLDYFYDHSPREIQKQVLIRQLAVAREVKLPIIIHCRDAWADLAGIVQDHWSSSGLAGILHCFTGTRDDAEKFLDWGFMISFAGNVTFKKAEGLREVARYAPLDRLLTETDSPYLAPVPHRGKRNEPSFVVETTRALAALRNLSEEEMGLRAVVNFIRFFQFKMDGAAGESPDR